MRGGAAELTVVDYKRARQAQQRLHRQERDLPPAGDRPPDQQQLELLPCRADRQVQVIP
jgi:hypothetical protein